MAYQQEIRASQSAFNFSGTCLPPLVYQAVIIATSSHMMFTCEMENDSTQPQGNVALSAHTYGGNGLVERGRDDSNILWH